MGFPFRFAVPETIDESRIPDLRIALYQVLAGKYFTFKSDMSYMAGGKTDRTPHRNERLYEDSCEVISLSGNGLVFSLIHGFYHVDPTEDKSKPTLVMFSKDEVLIIQKNTAGDILQWKFYNFEPGAPMVTMPEGVETLDL